MSKALVIKNANFLFHRLDHIDIVEPVYCTGISLSQSTMSFTAIEAMSTLTATVTPANTTESVIWESSDGSVATVSNGVVTARGVGTATITAHCGHYSASCEVTVVVTFNANDFFKLDGMVTSDQTDLSADPPKDFAGVAYLQKGRMYADDTNTLDGYTAYSGYGTPEALIFSEVYPLPLPPNATKISVSAPSEFTSLRIVLLDAYHRAFYDIFPAGARARAKYYSSAPFEYTLPEDHDANGFVFSLWMESGGDASTVTGDVIVTIT